MRRQLQGAALCAVMAVSVSGCATSAGQPTDADSPQQDKVIAEQQTRIQSLESELGTSQRELELARAASTTADAAPSDELFPPDAMPGRCYARVLIPATYRDEQETVLLKEASKRVEIIPARYETVEERVLTKEASTRLEVVPARYETVQERVMVQPESTRIEEIPATYKTVSEQVLVASARTEWKRGPAGEFSGVLDSRTTDTGEIMCLVEVPAQYRTVTRTVVDQPASTREVKIPAQYQTVEKTVLVEPATTREITIPAEYGMVEVTKLASPASDRKIEIPAEYGKVSKRIKVSEDRLEWRQVLCDINMTPDTIRKLQTALRDKGHNPGAIDGILGSDTLTATKSFARANNLPYGSNYITVTVAEELGLRY